MTKKEIIDFTKEFMNETSNYENVRAGGNMGMIIAGYIISVELEKIVTALEKGIITNTDREKTPCTCGEAPTKTDKQEV